MNTQPGIFGRKIGSTQLFEQDGTVTRVTVVEAELLRAICAALHCPLPPQMDQAA